MGDREQRHELHRRVDRDITYRPPNDAARYAHELLRAEVAKLAHLAIDLCPPGRELSLGLTKLVDEALAHFNAAVARHHDRLQTPPDRGITVAQPFVQENPPVETVDGFGELRTGPPSSSA